MMLITNHYLSGLECYISNKKWANSHKRGNLTLTERIVWTPQSYVCCRLWTFTFGDVVVMVVSGWGMKQGNECTTHHFFLNWIKKYFITNQLASRTRREPSLIDRISIDDRKLEWSQIACGGTMMHTAGLSKKGEDYYTWGLIRSIRTRWQGRKDSFYKSSKPR
jgi:hypothetical protein